MTKCIWDGGCGRKDTVIAIFITIAWLIKKIPGQWLLQVRTLKNPSLCTL